MFADVPSAASHEEFDAMGLFPPLHAAGHPTRRATDHQGVEFELKRNELEGKWAFDAASGSRKSGGRCCAVPAISDPDADNSD